MVTNIHQHGPRVLYLREHRKAKGVSARDMAGRLGIERESVYRIERETWRADPAEWADLLGVELQALYSLPRPADVPPKPSLDQMVADQPEDVQEKAFNIIRLLVGKG